MNNKIMNEMTSIKDLFVSGNKITIYGTKENPLFMAVEIARLIDYSVGNTHHMLDCVDEDEKILLSMNFQESHGRSNSTGVRNVIKEKWFLTEYGLYEVLMQSRKPIAKIFKRSIKNILNELRIQHEEKTGEPFYEVSDLYEQWKGWTDLRDDMGYPEIPFKEFLQSHPEADVELEMRLYNEKINNGI